jgi:hypothetical protein
MDLQHRWGGQGTGNKILAEKRLGRRQLGGKFKDNMKIYFREIG